MALTAAYSGLRWGEIVALTAGQVDTAGRVITAAEPVAGIGLGIVVFGDSIRVSPGLILLEASG
jgi:hypothetical protein